MTPQIPADVLRTLDAPEFIPSSMRAAAAADDGGAASAMDGLAIGGADAAYYEAAAAAAAAASVAIEPPPPAVYNMYAAPRPAPHRHPPSKMTPIHSFFMPEDLRQELQKRNDALHLDAADRALPEGQALPRQLHQYHSFVLLEHHEAARVSRVFQLRTWLYKVTDDSDGQRYVLRRVEGVRPSSDEALSALDLWRRVRHPGVVSLKEAFTTRAFNDNSLAFVYSYHPNAHTLHSRYFAQHAGNAGMAAVPEKLLLSFMTQLLSAVRAVHAMGLSVRVLDPTKILITGENRFRIGCGGMLDALAFAPGQPPSAFQQDDLFALGQLFVMMACSCAHVTPATLPAALDFCGRSYRQNGSVIRDVILHLLSKPTPQKTAADCFAILASQFCMQMDHQFRYIDSLERQLCHELENGRLVRLLCKLGFVNERPEFDMDPAWSETGDRYLLKLFRDHVFHQVDENMRPVVDMGHVLACLNKFDAGTDERLMLMSRNEQSCIITSYQDLKRCAETAYSELLGNP